MNQVLKLPQKAVDNLIIEHKTLLFFASYPENFDFRKDDFIVEIEETGKVFGYISCRLAYSYKYFLIVYLKNRKNIAWMEKSFWYFLFSRKRHYVFVDTSYIVYKQAKSSIQKAVQ